MTQGFCGGGDCRWRCAPRQLVGKQDGAGQPVRGGSGGRGRRVGRVPGALGLVRSGGLSLPPCRRAALRSGAFPGNPCYRDRPGGRRLLVDEQRPYQSAKAGTERTGRREPGLVGRAADKCQRGPGSRVVGVALKPRAALVAIVVVGRVFVGALETNDSHGVAALAWVGPYVARPNLMGVAQPRISPPPQPSPSREREN